MPRLSFNHFTTRRRFLQGNASPSRAEREEVSAAGSNSNDCSRRVRGFDCRVWAAVDVWAFDGAALLSGPRAVGGRWGRE